MLCPFKACSHRIPQGMGVHSKMFKKSLKEFRELCCERTIKPQTCPFLPKRGEESRGELRKGGRMRGEEG